MQKTIIHTDKAPAAIGPYSQAVKVDQTVYLSGQIALNPVDNQFKGGDIREQTRQVFANLQAVCEAAGGSLADVVKLQIYLTDLSHFETVNELMRSELQEPFPARAAIGVSQLPKGALVEMDGVAVISR